MVSHRTVLGLASLFWISGAVATSSTAVKNLYTLPSKSVDAPSHDPHHFWVWLTLFLGIVAFVVFYGPCVFMPLALHEVQRILSLKAPRVWHFFDAWRLLALLILIPGMVVLNKHTQEYFLADMVFGGTVIPVALGLWGGGLFIMKRACCEPRAIAFASVGEHLLEEAPTQLSGLGDATAREEADVEGSQVILQALDFRGPRVGVYSIEMHGRLYDLNDHYSRPREFLGVLVRSPIEFGINIVAFFVLLWMTAYAAQAETVPGLHVGRVDWLVVPFKLTHLFFHSLIHLFPNYSQQNGLKHMKCPRIICGIVFGLSRYAVFLILAYRYSLAACIALGAAFVIFTPLRLLGELLKTAAGVAVLGVAMCSRAGCSGNCYLCAAGGLLQLLATGSFYLVGQCRGHRFREWRRKQNRVWLPYHVISDIGNALWIIGANYMPGSAAPVAYDIGIANTIFPSCGWR